MGTEPLYRIKKLAVLACLAIGLTGTQACAADGAIPPPEGWREIDPAIFAGTIDAELRAESKSAYLQAAGDFDGDGKPDIARLFVNPATQKFGLFVTLAGDTSGWRHKLDEGSLHELESMGIAMAPPDTYHVYCGEDVCAPLTLTHSGIFWFTFEKSGQTFYWTGKEFASKWTSD